MIKNLLINNTSTQITQSSNEDLILSEVQALDMISNMIKPNSLESIKGGPLTVESSELHNLMKNSFGCLKEGGIINLKFNIQDEQQDQQIQSYAKMVGYQSIQYKNGTIQGAKPKFNSSTGPPKIRRKQKQGQSGKIDSSTLAEDQNPWANLQEENTNPWGNLQSEDTNSSIKKPIIELINEDELMKVSETTAKKIVKKCGEKDSMGMPKACANCSCGLKEKLEGGKVTLVGDIKDLENGNTESSCGKCYLGDAFRCAACPYRGLAAFEKGDKVKLAEDVGSRVQVAENTTNQLEETKAEEAQPVKIKETDQNRKVIINTDDFDMDIY